jgi:hypothetical protein
MSVCRVLSVVAASVAFTHLSWAGPPLSIDDPGILDPWQWEIITATTATSTDGGDFYQAPLIDVSLGLTENIQIAAAYPYVYSDPDGGSSDWDFGNFEAGIKWRFINNENVQVAFSPRFAWGVTRELADQGIGDDSDTAFIPVTFEYAVNDAWTVTGEIGYAMVEDSGDEWGYGWAFTYGLNDKADLLLELSGSADTDIENDFVTGRVGLDYGFTEAIHGLFAVATGLREPSGEDELDYDIFIGLQYFR